jgi:hypothetical protein
MIRKLMLLAACFVLLLTAACEKVFTPGTQAPQGSRLKSVSTYWPNDSSTVVFTYDIKGRVHNVRQQPGYREQTDTIEMNMEYDAYGRVTVLRPPFYHPAPFYYHYDGYGRIDYIVHPRDWPYKANDTVKILYNPVTELEEDPDVAAGAGEWLARCNYYYTDNNRNITEYSGGTNLTSKLMAHYFTYTKLINPEFEFANTFRTGDFALAMPDYPLFYSPGGYEQSRFLVSTSKRYYSEEYTDEGSFDYDTDQLGRATAAYITLPDQPRRLIKKYVYE